MHAEGQTNPGGVTPEISPQLQPGNKLSRVDELAERLRAANADTTLTTIILDNWQRTVGTVAIVFLGFWLYNEYQAKQNEQIGELSRRFDEARRSLVTLTVDRPAEDAAAAAEATDPAAKKEPPAGDAAAKAEQTKKDLDAAVKGANDTFDLLQTTGSGTAYSTFADTYRALASAYRGESAEAVNRLKVFKPEKYFTATEPTASQQATGTSVTAEAAALLTARLNADQNLDLARQQLSALSLSAQFANSEALLSLFRLSETEDQKTAAISVARRVIIARPEQLDQIQADLAPFGFKSES